MSTSLLSLPVTSLQTLVSVVLVPTTVFAQKIHKLYFPYHHLYTNIQMSTSLLSLPVTSLQTLVSVVLVPTTVFALSEEYIPVGCVPPASVTISGGVSPGVVCLPRRVCLLGGCTPPLPIVCWNTPPVVRILDTCL